MYDTEAAVYECWSTERQSLQLVFLQRYRSLPLEQILPQIVVHYVYISASSIRIRKPTF